jgi:hypothetical protein
MYSNEANILIDSDSKHQTRGPSAEGINENNDSLVERTLPSRSRDKGKAPLKYMNEETADPGTGSASRKPHTSSATPLSMPKHTDKNFRPLHVFLLVRVGMVTKVSQIVINKETTSPVFFKNLRLDYFRLRGFLRTWFGVWRYSHCDFYQVSGS